MLEKPNNKKYLHIPHPKTPCTPQEWRTLATTECRPRCISFFWHWEHHLVGGQEKWELQETFLIRQECQHFINGTTVHVDRKSAFQVQWFLKNSKSALKLKFVLDPSGPFWEPILVPKAVHCIPLMRKREQRTHHDHQCGYKLFGISWS